MIASSYKRVVMLLAAGLALSATGLATAAEPAHTPVGPDARKGLRPLERLAAALPAGRRELAAPASRAPLGGTAPRSVGEAIAGDRARGRSAVFPVKGSAGFGEAAARFGSNRSGHVHEGQDVFAPAGTPLVAVRDGVVVETGDDGGRGNYVALYSPKARQTYVYLHMNERSRVAPGRRVRAGGRIGSVGCTGSCFGDHLHFEVRRGRGTQAPAIDPLPLLMRWRSAS